MAETKAQKMERLKKAVDHSVQPVPEVNELEPPPSHTLTRFPDGTELKTVRYKDGTEKKFYNGKEVESFAAALEAKK
tara:strand:- start:757 stop:987 length:231 start_codon:yes stop_codon:yes gene_type:complete